MNDTQRSAIETLANHPNGRPRKYTPHTVAKILVALRRGAPLVHAGLAAGVCRTSVFEWKREKPEFAARVEAAIAQGITARLRRIERASSNDWRAAAWLLEHCAPEYFAKNRLEITGADGAPLAGAIAVYLPQKDANNGAHVVAVEAVKEITNAK